MWIVAYAAHRSRAHLSEQVPIVETISDRIQWKHSCLPPTPTLLIIILKLYKRWDLIHTVYSWHPRSFFTVEMYTYKSGFTIHYYANPNPNHKNGNNFRPQKLNSTVLISTLSKVWWVAATIVGLGFLDAAQNHSQAFGHQAWEWHGSDNDLRVPNTLPIIGASQRKTQVFLRTLDFTFYFLVSLIYTRVLHQFYTKNQQNMICHYGNTKKTKWL